MQIENNSSKLILYVFIWRIFDFWSLWVECVLQFTLWFASIFASKLFVSKCQSNHNLCAMQGFFDDSYDFCSFLLVFHSRAPFTPCVEDKVHSTWKRRLQTLQIVVVFLEFSLLRKDWLYVKISSKRVVKLFKLLMQEKWNCD